MHRAENCLLTDFGDDAPQYYLSLPSGLDRGAELGVVPGIDLAVASNIRGVGVHLRDLLWKRPIGSWMLIDRLASKPS